MTHMELKEALEVLGLSERATMKEIRLRHRQLVKRCHPDAGNGGDPELIRRVNGAYALVTQYVAAYRYDFGAAAFYEQNPDERLRYQFSGDPLWGNR